ncbi:MAG: 2-polyprenyl-3-methyl-6-methoxy-1,4-benzoquinone monooxygenase [Pseudomonadota bacterium]|nr:2-polyprenyl-3-methyl-6-methoxy-1,4-benzoquinone monooxygenase [Pseudomonadota bacterium]|tara:strand:- start:4398 stop:5033 length:636 start_codon:yes stop_codon:yes gene_type:complete
MRNFSKLDNFLGRTNELLNTISSKRDSNANYPASNVSEGEMNEKERKLSASLMRINHSGEIAAQGLYIGHAFISKNEDQKNLMLDIAEEEKDHLFWCKKRIEELGGKTSVFDSAWYCGSVLIGIMSGVYNDKVGLGFVEETEKQVSRHLDGHLEKIPTNDHKTREILLQMRADENKHGELAASKGSIEIPNLVKELMSKVSKIMINISYRF